MAAGAAYRLRGGDGDLGGRDLADRCGCDDIDGSGLGGRGRFEICRRWDAELVGVHVVAQHRDGDDDVLRDLGGAGLVDEGVTGLVVLVDDQRVVLGPLGVVVVLGDPGLLPLLAVGRLEALLEFVDRNDGRDGVAVEQLRAARARAVTVCHTQSNPLYCSHAFGHCMITIVTSS
ncbi:hypothetical protein [Tsukamurella soli]|uniref:hypothetical protein n=1 Tax=Tsukamurella soli TaxID=644556 RepID=UPI00360C00E3